MSSKIFAFILFIFSFSCFFGQEISYKKKLATSLNQNNIFDKPIGKETLQLNQDIIPNQDVIKEMQETVAWINSKMQKYDIEHNEFPGYARSDCKEKEDRDIYESRLVWFLDENLNLISIRSYEIRPSTESYYTNCGKAQRKESYYDKTIIPLGLLDTTSVRYKDGWLDFRKESNGILLDIFKEVYKRDFFTRVETSSGRITNWWETTDSNVDRKSSIAAFKIGNFDEENMPQRLINAFKYLIKICPKTVAPKEKF